MFFKVFKCNSHLIKFCLFLIQAIHMLILTLEMDTYCNKKYAHVFEIFSSFCRLIDVYD